ncbi:sensor histidine kinase [Paramesorhizobium deserti]|uniref:sensor histidine kinase n=1 Tax=Paramesorhizobium deserti TaxID=1494590 RepID=UPI000A8D17F9|nr:ATP-binding protein [Paramesorhizobium deserti]
MNSMIDRFRKASIRLQFIVFAAIPIPTIIICIIAILPEPFIFQNEKALLAKGAQIELLVTQLRHARNESEIENLIRSSAPLGLELKIAPWSDIIGERDRQDDHLLSDELRNLLPADFEAIVLENTSEGQGHSTLAVHLDARRALVIGFSGADVSPPLFGTIIEVSVKILILMLPMIVLVLYISTMITSPLVRFADAAGRLRLDGDEEEVFSAEGAKELHTLATSLNTMRRRIRKMVDDRTRMLTAVSHDLRTPLTRLKMRVERSKDPASREAMLADIDMLTGMIEESLQYLSSNATIEPLKKVDISSLLQTITSEFCDLGHTVYYTGPERFGYLCRQKALIRAVTNLVENAVRFGTIVDIELSGNNQGETVIVVKDNGPGLEDGFHDKVLEPFFKADEARTSSANTGFGLGLSIADEIVKGHGGSLTLTNISPHGLCAILVLPPVQAHSQQTSPLPQRQANLPRNAALQHNNS